jgi:hypothetical protein
MQCKESKHNETLKESFENIISFKECLINTWKTHQSKTRNKIGLKYKGNRIYPEAKHGHDLPSLGTPF